MTRQFAVAVIAGLTAIVPSAPAFGGGHLPERVVLTPDSGSSVRASVVLAPTGRGVAATATIRRAAPGAAARILVNAGTCKRPSASFATAGAGRISSAGSAHWQTRVLFRSTPVAWSTLFDGPHVLRLIVNGKEAACGAIPGMN